MNFSESYRVAVVGEDACVSNFFQRLKASAKEPKYVHLLLVQDNGNLTAGASEGEEEEDLLIGYIPDLSPMNTSAATQLQTGGGGSGGSIAARGSKRVIFQLQNDFSVAPDVLIGVLNSSSDAASVRANTMASPQSPSLRGGGPLGPTCNALLQYVDIAAHEQCPFLLVDMGASADDACDGGAENSLHTSKIDSTPAKSNNTCPTHVSSADITQRLLRRLHVLLNAAEGSNAVGESSTNTVLAGITPFDVFEAPLFVDNILSDTEPSMAAADGLSSPSPSRRGHVGVDAPALVDPAAFLTTLYNTLQCPRYLLWDEQQQCIRDDFVCHFRRCFWLLDKDRDGLIGHKASAEVVASSTTSTTNGGELHTAIASMFGICTDEDLREVLVALKEAEGEMAAAAADNRDDEDNEELVTEPLIVTKDGADFNFDDIANGDAPIPPFAITENGFIQYLHSLLSAGDHHTKGIWYMLKSFGHSPSLNSYRGNVFAEEGDMVALRRARVRAANEILHHLQETTEADLVLDDDEDIPDGDREAAAKNKSARRGRIFLTSKVVQGQLSPTGVAFFSSLFPSGPRVGHCKPSAFPSLKALWNVIPPSFPLPWAGVGGMPQPDAWLHRAEDLVLGRKQGSRSYATYTGKWKLENLFRFLECWEWAASGAVFMPSTAASAASSSPLMSSTVLKRMWWRQEAVVMYARQWGFRGDASKLFTFRPLREYREGRANVDGFPRLVHVGVVGAPACGKSALLRLITYDGCMQSDFLVDDDEHDIPTGGAEEGEGGESDGGEVDGADLGDGDSLNNRDAINVVSVTIDSASIRKEVLGGEASPSSSSSPRAIDSGLTTIYFYEVPSSQQASLFMHNDHHHAADDQKSADAALLTSSQSAAAHSRNKASAALPTSSAALWNLMHEPNTLACMDVCLGLFDGANPLGFSSLADVLSGSGGAVPSSSTSTSSSTTTKFWSSAMRLPIIPILTKADELPVGQILEKHHVTTSSSSSSSSSSKRRVGINGGSSAPQHHTASASASSAEAAAADAVAAFCGDSGLTWPPVITSAMSEALHPQFANMMTTTASAAAAITNAADDINGLVVQLAASPHALVGARVSREERRAEEAIERAAVMTRRIVIVSAGIGMALIAGKVISKLIGGGKKGGE